MDYILEMADEYLLDRVYATILPAEGDAMSTGGWLAQGSNLTLTHPKMMMQHLTTTTTPVSAWTRDYIPRQWISLFLLTWASAFVFYFAFASASYYFLFDHNLMKHPKFLKNQIKREIALSVRGFAPEAALFACVFLFEVRGHTLLYRDFDQYGQGWKGYAYSLFSVFAFIMFTDALIYYIHWWLHWPSVYKVLHKSHHMWKIPTPFASHAFHPLDGFAQSIPYHLFIFLVPLHRFVYIGLFVFVNLWSVLIHDGNLLSSNAVINGAGHHTLHHLSFTTNYGQYTTLFDRWMGTHREPTEEEINLRMGPFKRVNKTATEDDEVDSQGGQFPTMTKKDQ